MGELHIRAKCYDDVARIAGDHTAQLLWEANGGTGKYVPGMVACPSFSVIDGMVIHGHIEPRKP